MHRIYTAPPPHPVTDRIGLHAHRTSRTHTHSCERENVLCCDSPVACFPLCCVDLISYFRCRDRSCAALCVCPNTMNDDVVSSLCSHLIIELPNKRNVLTSAIVIDLIRRRIIYDVSASLSTGCVPKTPAEKVVETISAISIGEWKQNKMVNVLLYNRSICRPTSASSVVILTHTTPPHHTAIVIAIYLPTILVQLSNSTQMEWGVRGEMMDVDWIDLTWI